ncbi:hypothetical protein FWK45_01940 [Histophilus somni]|uniref:hypothetical protein n=2 Tax=Histophilus somni TaxID=731 RepID=UPI000B3B51F1|nr:hypothetical protein [Histophilus somni]ARU64351.1 hypothetical protein BTV18_01935 [Histophilus somni]ARU66138.1 hypothetical protein BTV19_01920 [Histophilus somni]ARU68012.1 hypothetical protein BTV16_01925 [Histophilus somni]ARU69892.1 hypothetical protein BTV20_01925 [Histophilus somni]ARU71767.1 hypothetical protein BTV17_01920 [Histophilus somni]
MKMNSYKIQILQNPISKKFYGEVWVDDEREYRTCKPMVSEINLENKEDINPFQLKSIFDEKCNPTIQFGLEVVLEKQIGAYPKTPVHLPISITYQSDREVAIEFTSTSKPAKFIVSLNEDKPYKDVIEAYKQIILSFFSV